MGEGYNDCCKVCCYSTPYGTIFALSVTVVGLVGFLSSSVYSVALLNATPSLENHTIIFAPVIGGIAGATVFPLVIATILSYCVTGYVRDELYHPFVKGCVGPLCSVWVIILTFVYFLLWLGLSVVLSLLMALYLELRVACDEDISSLECFTVIKENDVNVQVCGELGELCSSGLRIGLSLAISLVFSLFVVIGLALIMMVQGANFVGVRESNKRSYRPGANY